MQRDPCEALYRVSYTKGSWRSVFCLLSLPFLHQHYLGWDWEDIRAEVLTFPPSWERRLISYPPLKPFLHPAISMEGHLSRGKDWAMIGMGPGDRHWEAASVRATRHTWLPVGAHSS